MADSSIAVISFDLNTVKNVSFDSVMLTRCQSHIPSSNEDDSFLDMVVYDEEELDVPTVVTTLNSLVPSKPPAF